MPKKTYREKLLDPRWQKMRLGILERDDWTCQICGNKESTLHIHHRRYIAGNNPWDYPERLLVTLCEDCHEEEQETMKEAIDSIVQDTLKDRFFSNDIISINNALHSMPMIFPSSIMAEVIRYNLHATQITLLAKNYYDFLKNHDIGHNHIEEMDSFRKNNKVFNG